MLGYLTGIKKGTYAWECFGVEARESECVYDDDVKQNAVIFIVIEIDIIIR